MAPRVGPVCVLLRFFLTSLFSWISASSVTASHPLPTLTAVSCEDGLVLVEVVVFVLVEVCLGSGKYYMRNSYDKYCLNTSDIV